MAFHAPTPEEQVASYHAEWMADPLKVADQLVAFEEDGDSLAVDIAAVLTCHPDDLAKLAVEFFEAQRRKVSAALNDKAIEQVDTDEAAAFDRGCDPDAGSWSNAA